jgi:hypothetical protein
MKTFNIYYLIHLNITSHMFSNSYNVSLKIQDDTTKEAVININEFNWANQVYILTILIKIKF